MVATKVKRVLFSVDKVYVQIRMYTIVYNNH